MSTSCLLRPATKDDVGQLLMLAKQAKPRLTSLYDDEARLAQAIAASEQALATVQAATPHDQHYWFVIDDTALNKVIGVCSVVAAKGSNLPFYTYRVTHMQRFSRGLGVSHTHQLLCLNSDLQHCSEVAALYVDPAHRRQQLAQLLLQGCVMFMALVPQRFHQTVIAQIRGWMDGDQRSPFWEAVGQHFFGCSFAASDRLLGSSDKQFIADLLPEYPIPINLLPKAAQDSIGRPHRVSAKAKCLLEREGMVYRGMVDIFDAGPTIEARLDQLHTVQNSELLSVRQVSDLGERQGLDVALVTNNRLAYRAIFSVIQCLPDQGIVLSPQAADHLAVDVGDIIQCCRSPHIKRAD